MKPRRAITTFKQAVTEQVLQLRPVIGKWFSEGWGKKKTTALGAKPRNGPWKFTLLWMFKRTAWVTWCETTTDNYITLNCPVSCQEAWWIRETRKCGKVDVYTHYLLSIPHTTPNKTHTNLNLSLVWVTLTAPLQVFIKSGCDRRPSQRIGASFYSSDKFGGLATFHVRTGITMLSTEAESFLGFLVFFWSSIFKNIWFRSATLQAGNCFPNLFSWKQSHALTNRRKSKVRELSAKMLSQWILFNVSSLPKRLKHEEICPPLEIVSSWILYFYFSKG